MLVQAKGLEGRTRNWEGAVIVMMLACMHEQCRQRQGEVWRQFGGARGELQRMPF